MYSHHLYYYNLVYNLYKIAFWSVEADKKTIGHMQNSVGFVRGFIILNKKPLRYAFPYPCEETVIQTTQSPLITT